MISGETAGGIFADRARERYAAGPESGMQTVLCCAAGFLSAGSIASDRQQHALQGAGSSGEGMADCARIAD